MNLVCHALILILEQIVRGLYREMKCLCFLLTTISILTNFQILLWVSCSYAFKLSDLYIMYIVIIMLLILHHTGGHY